MFPLGHQSARHSHLSQEAVSQLICILAMLICKTNFKPHLQAFIMWGPTSLAFYLPTDLRGRGKEGSGDPRPGQKSGTRAGLERGWAGLGRGRDKSCLLLLSPSGLHSSEIGETAFIRSHI